MRRREKNTRTKSVAASHTTHHDLFKRFVSNGNWTDKSTFGDNLKKKKNKEIKRNRVEHDLQ